MFDIDKAIKVLDGYVNCSYRHCDECEEIYGIKDCVMNVYKDQYVEILKILEKARDNAIDNNLTIAEEDIIDLFRR